MQFIEEKAMGVLGRIVIPEELRETHNMQPGTPIGIYEDGNRIVLISHGQSPRLGDCFICGGDAKTAIVRNGKRICIDCVRDMAEVKDGPVPV